MKNNSLIVVGILIMTLLIGTTPTITHASEDNQSISAINTNDIGLDIAIPFGQIHIEGNADFQSQAIDYGWDLNLSRDGSIGDPYLISNYDFNGQNGPSVVNISNTDVYFVFQNNFIHNASSGTGIWLENVSNAVFDNNEIYNTNWGTFLIGLSNSYITNNYVHDNFHRGINLVGSNNVEISGNIINSIDGSGIVIEGGSSDIIVYHNVIEVTNVGISLWSGNNFIYNNSILTAFSTGIEVDFGSNNYITGNYIENVGQYLIELYSQNNYIEWNNFISGNHTGNEIVAYNQNFVINNYYDGYTSRNDSNGDKFADDSYSMVGVSDNLPLMQKYTRDTFVMLTSFDNSHYSPVFVEWISGFDEFSLSADYSMEYSTVDSPFWILLEEDNSNSFELFLDDISTTQSPMDISIKIRSISEGGIVSEYISPVFQLFQGIIPDAPEIDIISSSGLQITINWDDNFNQGSHPLLHYNIYQSVNGEGYEFFSLTTNTEITIGDHIDGFSYEYVVTAVSATGESGQSNFVGFHPPDVTSPDISVSGLSTSIQNNLTGTVLLAFEIFDNVGISSVEVSIISGSVNEILTIQSRGSFSYNFDTSDFENGLYEIVVLAIDVNGLSSILTFDISIFNEASSAEGPSLELPFDFSIILFSILSISMFMAFRRYKFD